MSTTIEVPKTSFEPADPEAEPLVLENGARMSREEFHRLYEQTPEDFRAELIGGIVYVASPLRRTHEVGHFDLTTLFGVYKFQTPGVEGGDNGTLLLGADSEPQPDLYLRILPEYGGQSRTTVDDDVEGAPELVVEIALSSRSLDLNDKRRDYAKYGAREYIVVVPRAGIVAWFDLTVDCEIPIPDDGILKSRMFPGLWLSVPAILKKDWNAAMTTLHMGLQSPEHQAFVEQLAQRSDASQ